MNTGAWVGAVTGQVYQGRRVRGLAAWRPHGRTRQALDHVLTVLDTDRAYWPLTARQVFYRLVGAFDYDKTEAAYKRLLELLNRGRRAGLVSWGAIRDDGAVELAPNIFGTPADFIDAVGAAAARYQLDRQAGQPARLEVWCEAAGMAPQLARVADPLGVPVYSGGGFDSVTAKHEAARRMVAWAAGGSGTRILHVGDFDPSGCAVVDSLADDLGAFCADLGAPGVVAVERVAVTPDQVERFGLPWGPAKAGPGGAMRRTVQAEALTPADLAAELQAALNRHTDAGARAVVLATEARQRAALCQAVERLGGAS